MKVEEFYRKMGLKLVLTWKYSDLKKKGFQCFCQTQLSNERYTSGYEYVWRGKSCGLTRPLASWLLFASHFILVGTVFFGVWLSFGLTKKIIFWSFQTWPYKILGNYLKGTNLFYTIFKLYCRILIFFN